MKPARRALAIVLAAALAPGCASTLTLQDVPVGGREVTVEVTGSKSAAQGRAARAWTRTRCGSAPRTACASCRCATCSEVRVKRHGFGARKALTWALRGRRGHRRSGSRRPARRSRTTTTAEAVGLVTGGLWLLAGALDGAGPGVVEPDRVPAAVGGHAAALRAAAAGTAVGHHATDAFRAAEPAEGARELARAPLRAPADAGVLRRTSPSDCSAQAPEPGQRVEAGVEREDHPDLALFHRGGVDRGAGRELWVGL